MFDVVSSRVSFPDLDAEVLEYWKERDVFRRSVDDRPDAPLFMMYEGRPRPTAARAFITSSRGCSRT